MNTAIPEVAVKTAAAVTTGISAINPVVGGIVACGFLLIGFGCSGIPKLIEKAIDENSDKR
ncbi:MAG: hypothetical protein HDT25_11330 [Ruminococcus sp.]|nr:hypothetical protein [Ruminococcus sp.]